MKPSYLRLLILFLALICASMAEQDDRWLLVDTDADGGKHYIDTRTINWTSPTLVEFWVKCENPQQRNTAGREYNFKHCYRIDTDARVIRRIDRDRRAALIPPESMPEAYMDLLTERRKPRRNIRVIKRTDR